MKLATAFGYIPGDEGRDEQRRLGPFLALCLDQRRDSESVYRFDFGVEAVLVAFNQQINHGISATVPASWRRVDLGVNPRGPLERLASGVQDSAFGVCYWHGTTRSVQHNYLYTHREHNAIMNMLSMKRRPPSRPSANARFQSGS